ncbi:MAG: HAD hydrolase family protein [Acidobacteria bacterium]|nr:HAD hydrolase family protein [Acidobacteriota bacterium]
MFPAELVERARKIKLLLMDCDGVLTDGKIYFLPMPDGSTSETKCFDCQDGIALQWAWKNGVETGIISGRGGMAVKERARSAHMRYLFEGNTEKLPLLEQVMNDSGLTADEIAYVGDDVTDIPLLKRVGLAAAPSNARAEVLDLVHYAVPRAGGSGAIREVIELILKSQGKWDAIWAKYDV